MSSCNIKNYCMVPFQYPTLNKIHRQPTLDMIIHLICQLKINAQDVPTTLGGYQLGYLALVLPPTSYNTIPNAQAFVCPQEPGPFIVAQPSRAVIRSASPPPVSPTNSAAVITQQKAAWDKHICLYNECQAVEQVLCQELIKLVELVYLDALCNQYTKMVQDSIPDIIEHLRKTYGSITDEELSNGESELKAFIYNLVNAVDKVLTRI